MGREISYLREIHISCSFLLLIFTLEYFTMFLVKKVKHHYYLFEKKYYRAIITTCSIP